MTTKLSLLDITPRELKLLKDNTGETLQSLGADLTLLKVFLFVVGRRRQDPGLSWDELSDTPLRTIVPEVDATWDLSEDDEEQDGEEQAEGDPTES